MGSESVQFLEGLRAGASSEDVKNCKVLLEAIEKFGSVEVWVDE
jgi:hypothetical protein